MSNAPAPSKQRSFEVAKRVLVAARGIVPKGEFETATINAVAITLYWRCISMYEAILLLAKAEHPEEALILARSLFEDSLVLHEIHVAGPDRAALIVKWLNNSLSEKEALMKEAKRLDLPGDQTDVLAQLAKQRVQIQAFSAKHTVVRPRAFSTPRDAAMKFGRREDYWTYRLAHEMTHGSDAAAVYRRRKSTSGTYMFHGKTSDVRIMAGLVTFSARSLLQGAKATAAMLSWHDKGELESAETAVRMLDA